jgi:hypothetical protein
MRGVIVVADFTKRIPATLQSTVRTYRVEVFRLVHHTHATAADFAQYAVMGNRLTDGLGRSVHWVDMLGGEKGEVNRNA